MFSNLFSRIKTKDDIDILESEIDLLLDSLYKGKDSSFDSTLASKVRKWVAEALRQDLESVVNKEEALKKLIEDLKTYRILTLTLAFEPTEKSIDLFYKFIRENCGERVVLEFCHNPDIFGGAEIIFEGEYYDFSLKKAFEEEFAKSKEEILRTAEVGVAM